MVPFSSQCGQSKRPPPRTMETFEVRWWPATGRSYGVWRPLWVG